MRFYSFDRSYVERLRGGDAATHQHFVAYFSALINMKLRKRLSSNGIQDLCQETLMRTWAALQKREASIRSPEALGAFVNSVCNNVLLEHYRRLPAETPQEAESEDEPPDPGASAVDLIATAETRVVVRQILQRLSPQERYLLEQVFVKERDRHEVSKELGLTPDYLRVLLHRAKKSFRKQYSKALAASMDRASAPSSTEKELGLSARVLSFGSRRKTAAVGAHAGIPDKTGTVG